MAAVARGMLQDAPPPRKTSHANSELTGCCLTCTSQAVQCHAVQAAQWHADSNCPSAMHFDTLLLHQQPLTRNDAILMPGPASGCD
jgi:hypothetical protein